MIATVVDTGDLLETVAASLAAGVGVTFVFSLAILGVARFADLSRDGRPVAAAAFGVLAMLALAASTAAVTFGIVVMTQK
jgi:hypothetical protein